MEQTFNSSICQVSSKGPLKVKVRVGRLFAAARTAYLVLIMLDATKPDIHRTSLENELESVGIGLNKPEPHIYFKIKKTGEVNLTSMVPLTHLNDRSINVILHEYKIRHAEVIFREDSLTEDFIDVIAESQTHSLSLRVQQDRSSIHRGGGQTDPPVAHGHLQP